jgi:hypothetical protein
MLGIQQSRAWQLDTYRPCIITVAGDSVSYQ